MCCFCLQLRGGRQRVIVKKKRFANDRFIRELLCASCFDKLLTLADKGYQLNKLFSYTKKKKRGGMEREHSILRRSNTVAEFQMDPSKQEERAELRERQTLPRVSSMPNLQRPQTPEPEVTSTRQEVASEDDWEISVEEVGKEQVLESDDELVTVRVVAQDDDLKTFGHDNRGYDDEEGRDFHTVSSKTRTVDDITFKFTEGFLTKGHSLTNICSEAQKKPKPFFSRSFKHRVIGSKTQKTSLNNEKLSSQIKVYFGDSPFGNTLISKSMKGDAQSALPTPMGGNKFLGHGSVEEGGLEAFVQMENELNKKDIRANDWPSQDIETLQRRRDAFRSIKTTFISDHGDNISLTPPSSLNECVNSQNSQSFSNDHVIRKATFSTPKKLSVKYSSRAGEDAKSFPENTPSAAGHHDDKKVDTEYEGNYGRGPLSHESFFSESCVSRPPSLQTRMDEMCSDITQAGNVTPLNKLLNDNSAPAPSRAESTVSRQGEAYAFGQRDKSDSGYCESDDIT